MKGVGYVFLAVLFSIVFALLTAETSVCPAQDISEERKVEIVQAAALVGESFRLSVDALRDDGVNFKNDTTLVEFLSSRRVMLNRARELYSRQGIGDRIYRDRLERGETLDTILMDRVYPLHPSQNNYLTMSLDQHLENLVLAIGGKPTDQKYRFLADPNEFVLALSQFARSAGLVHLSSNRRGLTLDPNRAQSIGFWFRETWPLFRSDKLVEFLVSITTDRSNSEVFLRATQANGYDYVVNLNLRLFAGNRSCLASFRP